MFSSWLGLIVFFQAEDGIRDLVRSRGLGDVYKRQTYVYDISDRLTKMIGPGNTVTTTISYDLVGRKTLSLIHI